MTASLPPIALDKSFAHAASAREIESLAARWTLLVPDAFYWEIFTTGAAKRTRAVESLPPFRRVHLPPLFRQETETGKAVVEISTPPLRTNPMLNSEKWFPSAEEAAVLERYKKESVEPMLSFWRQVISARGIPGFTASELECVRGAEEEFTSLCLTLRETNRIRKFAREIEYAHAAEINHRWLHFRQFQAWALHALILLRRHQNAVAEVPNPTRLEHDVQDIEYFILGLHCGALATADDSAKPAKRSLSCRYRLLAPDFVSISPASRSLSA